MKGVLTYKRTTRTATITNASATISIVVRTTRGPTVLPSALELGDNAGRLFLELFTAYKCKHPGGLRPGRRPVPRWCEDFLGIAFKDAQAEPRRGLCPAIKRAGLADPPINRHRPPHALPIRALLPVPTLPQ